MTLADQKSIQSVMVVGYGAMGRGIVSSFAGAGFSTAVLTRNRSRPHRSTARRNGIPKASG